MRFSYAETFATHLPRPARGSRQYAGYDSFVVPDSLIFPAASDTLYPYTADGDRAFLEDKPIIEPFTLIPYLAARTNRILFTTFVLKLAVRPVVLVAKQAASIVVLCDDRLRLGVGISPWPEDFAAMDVPWERRGKRMDEMVEVLGGLMAGDWYQFHGDDLHLERCRSAPHPKRRSRCSSPTNNMSGPAEICSTLRMRSGSTGDMIVKVKEPIAPEYPRMRENQLLFTYLHLAPEFELTKQMLRRKVTGVAYETITDAHGRLPLLTPMSEVAGRMSVQVGATYLEKMNGGPRHFAWRRSGGSGGKCCYHRRRHGWYRSR